MRNKVFAVVSILILASMVLGACAPATPQEVIKTVVVEKEGQQVVVTATPPPPPEFKSKDPSTFVQVVFGEPETLDPALDYETAGGEIIQNVYETLITYNKDKPSEFVPQLATEWSISDDGLTYTFKIRQGVKFHNGNDMTPSDVAYTFVRGILQGGTASPQWLLTEPFFGVGVDDIAAVVAQEITAKVDAKRAELVAGADLAALNADAVKALLTELAAYYTEQSGFAVDAATVDAAAVDTLVADIAALGTDDEKKAKLDEGLNDLFSGLDGADPTALYDDAEAMQKVNTEILVAVAEMVKSKIVADDANWTVTMKLAQPWGPFIPTIAQFWGSVMDQDWVIENGGWDGDSATWAKFYAVTSENDPFTSITNGTGPYMLESWTKGQELVLVANPNYWRTEPAWEGGPTGAPAIQRIVIKKVDEWGTRFAMLQTGDADFASVNRQDASQVDPYVGEKCVYNNETQEFDACEVVDPAQPLRLWIGAPSVSRTDVFLNFNIVNPEGGNPLIGSGQLDGNGIPPDFFSDVHIRKAFNYCFDWDTFIQDALVGEAVQSIGIPLPGMPGYDPNGPKYSFDLDKCAEEFQLADLDKDGVPAGQDDNDVWSVGFRFQAAFNIGNTTRQTVAEILAANLAEVNDKFAVEIVGLPWPTFLRNQRARTLPLFISGWIEDIHDPHNWYQPYILGTYGRRQGLPDDLRAQFEELINAGVAEADPAKRDVIYKELNQKIFDAAPQIILAIATIRHYEQRWVQGWYYNPISPGTYFYALSKK